jgi:flagellar biosynthetic protein FlhB
MSDLFGLLRDHCRVLLGRSSSLVLNVPSTLALVREAVWLYVKPFALLAGGVTLLPLAVHLAMTRLGFAAGRLKPDLARLNPAPRLKELAGNNAASFFKAALILPLLLWAVYRVAESQMAMVAALPRAPLAASLALVSESIRTLLWKAAAVIVAIGLIDLLREWRRYSSRMRMTKQEVREEFKESEGNPLVKMQIRRIQRDRVRKQMLQHVPTATAVITNPTHYAVAIRYEVENMAVPVVVAKGKNLIARRIREIAIANNVPIVENPPLARALYQSVDVGREIPVELYRAVAEILAYIYRLMHPHAGGAQRGPGRNY